MAVIDPTQDYDLINTLTFTTASGTCKIRLYRGSSTAFSGTVYYRAGTSGEWTALAVASTATTFPVTSTTMQVALDWNKSGDAYMTPSFYGQATNLVEIGISQKAVLSGVVGNYFMYYYVYGCTSLTSIAVPDTSGLTSVGDYFMYAYARNCTSLTSIAVPDTSGLTSVGFNFMYAYARNCTSLTSIAVPDTSGLTSVGNFFMAYYVYDCTSLTSLAVPDTSGLTSVGSYFMAYYVYDCTSLTSIILPLSPGWFADHNVNWAVPSARLNLLYAYAPDSTSQTAWQALTVSPKTLYTNYVRDNDHVLSVGGGATAPTVTTQAVSSITQTTATGNGNVTADGGATVTERGVCWGTSTNPTIAGSHASAAAGGTGAFTASITGLSASTHYYVRAYATNSEGTSYGDNVEFDSLSAGTNMKINIGDTFKTVEAMKLNVGDSWKTVVSAKVNVGDVWKDIF